MSFVDDLLSSELLVWFFLILGAFGLYLKKTNQTLPDVIRRIKETYEKITEDNKQNAR